MPRFVVLCGTISIRRETHSCYIRIGHVMMRLFLAVFFFLVLGSQESYAGRKLFFFSNKRGICINAEGQSGLNQDVWSECTNFKHKNLRKGVNRIHLEQLNINLRGSSFEGVNVSRVHFRGTDLRFTDFRNAKMHNVIFENVDLRNADLRGADLSGAQFIGDSPAKRYQLQGALFDEETIWDHSDFPSKRAFAAVNDMVRVIESEESEVPSKELGYEGVYFHKWVDSPSGDIWARFAWSYPIKKKLIDVKVANPRILEKVLRGDFREKEKVSISIENQTLTSIEKFD